MTSPIPTTTDPALAAARAAKAALDDAIQLAEQQGQSLTTKIADAKTELLAITATENALRTGAPADLAGAANAVKVSCDLLHSAGLPAKIGSPLDEWKECRATIDRCDKILVDLRKTGFGFVTAVVGAAAYLFKGDDTFNHKASLLVMLVLLIVTLYLIDLAHQTWLGVAVTKAAKLEDLMGFELSKKIGQEFGAGRAGLLGFNLYFVMLIATCALFWISAPNAHALSGPRVTVYYAFGIGLVMMIGGAVDASEWGRDARKRLADSLGLPSKQASVFAVTVLMIIAAAAWAVYQSRH